MESHDARMGQSRRTDIVMDIKRLTRDERIKWMDHP